MMITSGASTVNLYRHCSSCLSSPVVPAGVGHLGTDGSVHGGSVQHVRNQQGVSPLAECVPSGMHVRIDRADARAEAQSEGVTGSLQVIRTPPGPTGVSQGATYENADYRSSSSASSAKKRKKKRARKTREPQHEMEGGVHATNLLQEITPSRVDQRDTPAGAVEHGDSTGRGGFGTDITNRKVVGLGRSSGGSDRFGEEAKSVEGKMGPRESTPAHPARRKVGLKPSCGRDVCGLVLGADEQACSKCTPAKVHGKNERLCFACHRPSTKWTHFNTAYLPRASECFERAKKRGARMPDAMVDGYRPSTDCLCTRVDCVAHFLRAEDKLERKGRLTCAVCKGYKRRKKIFTLPQAHVAEAIKFFTTGMGAERKHSTVDCTGEWLTEKDTLCPACRAAFYKHNSRSKAPISEVITTGDGRHPAVLAKEADREIKERLRCGRVVTLDEALDIIVRERRKLV